MAYFGLYDNAYRGVLSVSEFNLHLVKRYPSVLIIEFQKLKLHFYWL